MPAAANIRGLVGFLGDRRNLVITVKTREKPVDVNLAPTFGKSDMLVRRDVLITQENKPVFNEGRAQSSNVPVIPFLCRHCELQRRRPQTPVQLQFVP